MVPIMFHRLLKLPEAVRARYDLSSLKFVVHAAAPCPPPIKRAMIEWWGPVINEYYGSTEVSAVTFCTAQDWLSHPGTVGRPWPETDVRIIDAEGRPLPPHEIGEVVARTAGMSDFTYHGDDQKRRDSEKAGLIAPGDVGYFDEDGFLYLCDRAKDMIISGGVNIYPAEIEAELLKMPGVADCAVFGIPDEEFGEAVQAPGTIIYTSGTTGRPKGVRRAPPSPEQAALTSLIIGRAFGFVGHGRPDEIVTVVTGPMYHSAPNAYGLAAAGLGATVILQPRFDPEELLALIERHRVTHLHMVPIMFHRLLKLPDEVRARYDVSSLKFVVHAAAPCPPPIKRAMIEWWGPVIY
jgi:acyl-CoA synthetase (AMP-forming)/AMP-acid ligase II